jgi:PEP-CTERM motif
MMLRSLGGVVLLIALVLAPCLVQAAPITDTGIVFDATDQLISSTATTQTYQVTVTANTAGYTGTAGDFITSLAIKIANSVNSFSLVSGPPGSVLVDGGINASGCDGSGGGFVCDAFTPKVLPDATLTLILNETIGTGTLLSGNLAASIKAEYCKVGTGTGTGTTPTLGCPQSQNSGITSRDITLSPTPVPEPITMFLSGTGLLLLGYAARKRLFGGQHATAI